MEFPALILTHFCNETLQTVCINGEGLTEDGGPIEHIYSNIKCNYQDKAKTVYKDEDGDRKIVEITGSVYIDGNPFTEDDVISGGYVLINGKRREIYRGTKARNPDNTINHTRLELK